MQSGSRAELGVAALRIVALVVFLGALALALAWFDVLPGGWTLRSRFVDPREASARAQAEHSAARLAVFADENLSAPPGAILFLGSSSIERFPLAAVFPEKPTLNRGIANESVPELLARFERSLPRAPLAGLVLYAGRVEVRRDALDAEAFAACVTPLLDALSAKLAPLPVLVLGLLPERDMDPESRARLERDDERLASLARARGFLFVKTARAPLVGDDGSLAAEYAADRLHLDERGYAILAGWIREEGGAIARSLAP